MRRLAQISALVALLGFAVVSQVRADDDTSSLVGQAAPAFSLTGADGNTYNLPDEKGKVVVVDFWATWCPPCRASLPHIQHISSDNKLTDQGLVVWAVNAQEEKGTIDKFKDDNHYTFMTPMDSSGSTMQKYKVQGIPTTVVIGRDGVIKNVFVGYGDGVAGQIDDAIKNALAQSK